MLPGMTVEAASKNITVKDFIKSLVINLDLDISKELSEPYIMAAIKAGILKSTDFNNEFSAYITRTDAAVLLNRADEYLNRNTIDDQLLAVVLKSRISDIKKVPTDKREDVAKCYVKGIIKGYSNGYYIKNRSFKGSEYLTMSSAKAYINLLNNISKRAKLSPDGMLIRTTNLPKNANSYEYILECYPNEFYEKKFEFMFRSDWSKKIKDDEYYCYPVDMKNKTFKNWYDEWPLSEEMDEHLYGWCEMAEKYLNYVFNVDYRTVDDYWIDGLGSLYARSNLSEIDAIKKYYIGKIKENKVIVESSIIAVEPSTFYEDSDYCVRAYVRYRISAKDINVKQSKLIYTQYPVLDDLKNGEWREGIFDIRFDTNNGSSGDGSDFAINNMTYFVDSLNVPVE